MIQVENLQFTYPGSSHRALDGIGFSVQAGEIFGFLGPSGSGKSTTQKVLTGLLRGYEGKASVFGQDVRTMGSNYYEKIGVSFELPNHYRRLTGLENLEFFRSLFSVPTLDSQQLLERVGLSEFARKPVSAYSKGMQMRLTFIRALLNQPKLLFLDEPTSGLDPTNARVVKEMIREVRSNGTTVFLTTHNMNDATELCDRVAFIVDGQIRAMDTPRNLRLQYGRKVVRIEYWDENSLRTAEYSLISLATSIEFSHLIQTKQVETMHTLEASLEDVFVACTGRALQ